MRADQLTVQPGTYEHKPTQVQAMQLRTDTYRHVLAWMDAAGAYWWGASNDMAEIVLWLDSAAPGQDSKIRVRTQQGARKVLMEDWIVRGVGGLWYPIPDHVWRESYWPDDLSPSPDPDAYRDAP